LLTLITFRPDEFEPPWVPTIDLSLSRLERPEVTHMIELMTADRSLPREVVDQIVDKTEGVPLFVEEFVQAVLDAGSAAGESGRVVNPSLSPIAIPASLSDSLMSRLDRLGEARTIAQRGAILGRTFTEDLLRAVLHTESRDRNDSTDTWSRAERCLAQLVEADVLRRVQTAPTIYEFKHALIQNAAYQSLLNRTRQAYHLQTARVLETQFGHIAETQPELVARHYTEAVQLDRAFDYWREAAERARDRSANKEAIQHVASGLKVLNAMPESEGRERRELVLLIASITPVIAVEGYAAEATARTAERALLLCRKLSDVDRLPPVLYTLWANRIVGARYREALSLTEEFLREAAKQPDPAPRLISLRARGISLCMDGDLAGAETCLRESMALYQPHRHGELKNQGYGQDPYATCAAFMALVRWLRGYSDDAAGNSRQSVELAEQAKHTNTWGYVRYFGASLFEAFRGDVVRTTDHSTALLHFAEREALPVWLAYARVLHGWTLTHTGGIEDGLAEMKSGLVDFEDAASAPVSSTLRQGFMKSFLLSLLGDAYAAAKRLDESLAVLETAWSFAEARGEAFWKAELKRLRGEMILRIGTRSPDSRYQEAEESFLQARDIAAAQGAKALELRAAMSLNRLWRQTRPEDARRILTEAYGWFTQGFDSPDLVRARQLLDDLVPT
jgi:tetratricopeptide (TPR) repeat protein